MNRSNEIKIIINNAVTKVQTCIQTMETLYTHHSNNYACQLRTQGKLNMRPRQLNSFSTAFKKAEFRKARVITQSACPGNCGDGV